MSSACGPDVATGTGPAARPAAVSVPRPGDRGDLWLRLEPNGVQTPPYTGQPGYGSTASRGAGRSRLLHGHLQGGYTDALKLIRPRRGDHPDFGM